MSTTFHVPSAVVRQTFSDFRHCGRGRRECQVLWLSSWNAQANISEVVHPEHEAHIGGFVLDDRWLNAFWLRLARDNMGVRIQVHTHPREAFHSTIDDDYPLIHTPGFLSLVIPNFGLGPVGFESAYLAEIQEDGRWRQVPVSERLVVE